MNQSFLLFLVPVVFLKIPIEKSIAILFLTFTTYLYHNNETSKNIDFYRFLDQSAIINCCCLFAFKSVGVSILFLSLYLLETIYFQTPIIPSIVYFISSFKFIHNKYCLFFFICSIYIYLYLTFYQISHFNYYDRYLWHFTNVFYITIGLSMYYQNRLDLLSNIYPIKNKYIQYIFENFKMITKSIYKSQNHNKENKIFQKYKN
jgi:hypothetical protein